MMYTKANALNSTPGIFACTYRVVVLFVPPLLSLGVLKQTGCLMLGTVIGIVVACWSICTQGKSGTSYPAFADLVY